MTEDNADRMLVSWQLASDGADGWTSPMTEWLTNGGYQPHGVCLLWDQTLMSLYTLGNAGIVVAYLMIPCMLIWTSWRLRGLVALTPNWVLFSFASFIFCCAMSHAIDIANLYLGWYWVEAIWLNVTAFVSLFAALALPFAIRTIVRRATQMTVGRILMLPDQPAE
jgi:hypothetical protein